MRLGSLFAGIGGFDLAARWMGWETAWFSEIDPYASAVLAKHWPGVPNHGDITRIDFAAVEPVDMLCGGFPCQDISNAGKRKGISGERSGLWSEYARAIRELRPRYVVVENVAALLARGINRVLGDLSEVGYDAEWTVLSAAEVGAPHLRERVWVVAYPREQAGRRVLAGRWQQFAESSEGAWDVADGESNGLQEQRVSAKGNRMVVDIARSSGLRQDADSSGRWWAVEPDVGRVAHGVPARVDRLKGLGNAIVPHCAYDIFRAIEAREQLRDVA